MTDPSAYLANLGSDLTGGVLKALRRRAEEFALGTPKYQALKRCYAAAELALLPPDHPHFEPYLPLLQTFLAEPEVAQELAKLVKGRSPDVAALVDVFNDVSHGRSLPPIDIELRLRAGLEAFLQQAEQEAALQGDIQTAQLRDLVTAIQALPADLAAAIEQMLGRLQPGSGNITFEGDTVVQGDIITGFKIGTSPPAPPAPPDPCEALGRRYLRALASDVVALPLAALDDEGADSRRPGVTLDRVYIDLHTRRAVEITEAEKKDAPLDWRLGGKRPVTMLEAAAQQRRLVLLGDPGSGKSVFVNHLAYLHAQTHLHQTPLPEPLAAAPHWPVRFILRELAAHLTARLDTAEFNRLTPRAQKQELLAAARDYLLVQFTLLELTPDEAEQWHTCLRDRPCLTIFDGLDEVPLAHLPWIHRLIELWAGRRTGPVIITCRIRSYETMAPLAGFATETLAPFTGEQQTGFIQAWYAAQPGLSPAVRQERVANLKDAVRDLPADLTGSPLLLTTLALIHTVGTELPRERARLYARGVEVLMRRWQRHKHGQTSVLDQLGVEPSRLLEGLRALAYEAQRATEPGQTADVDEDRAVGLLARTGLGSRHRAEQFLAYVDRQAGLLVGRGGSPTAPPVYRFAHRTFQEYLAGCHLASQRVGLARTIRERLADGERWYLVAQLAAEHLLYNNVQRYPVLDLLYDLCPVSPPPDEAGWRGVAWAGVIAAEMGADLIAGDDKPDGGLRFLARLTPWLAQIVAEGMLTVAERADAGDALARLDGDARPGVGLLPPFSQGNGPTPPPAGGRLGGGRVASTAGSAGLPHHQFCYIPPGPFWLGSIEGEDELANKTEYGHTEPFNLNHPYWLSRYPVTQAQYEAFVQATGHRAPYHEEDWARSYNWHAGKPPPRRRNQPVVLISWHDAVAYCDWLNERICESANLRMAAEVGDVWQTIQSAIANRKSSIRLPTEAEWEKAARGGLQIPRQPVILTLGASETVSTPESLVDNPDPKRRWPWGAWSEASPGQHANVAETRRGGPTAVGSFPAGASPYGCQDMAGNVWEWTLSKFQPYPFQNDDRHGLAGDDSRTLRGGSWSGNQRDARVSNRYFYHPDYFYDDIGFRVVVAPNFFVFCRQSQPFTEGGRAKKR